MIHYAADERVKIAFTLNGRVVEGEAEPRMQLADFLRHRLKAYGTHVGCEHGVCGACTVLVDGRATRSCLMLAVQAQDCTVETIEGLGSPQCLSRLQECFSRHHALQCGFCTPGILMSTVGFLRQCNKPNETEVRDMLSGHICRCTGYQGMVKAVLEIAHDEVPTVAIHSRDEK
jgi:2-furoyl-CoA dehydrogenase 2Fe-2S iron sulfur subunit